MGVNYIENNIINNELMGSILYHSNDIKYNSKIKAYPDGTVNFTCYEPFAFLNREANEEKKADANSVIKVEDSILCGPY